jgi:hypothetical protein
MDMGKIKAGDRVRWAFGLKPGGHSDAPLTCGTVESVNHDPVSGLHTQSVATVAWDNGGRGDYLETALVLLTLGDIGVTGPREDEPTTVQRAEYFQPAVVDHEAREGVAALVETVEGLRLQADEHSELIQKAFRMLGEDSESIQSLSARLDVLGEQMGGFAARHDAAAVAMGVTADLEEYGSAEEVRYARLQREVDDLQAAYGRQVDYCASIQELKEKAQERADRYRGALEAITQYHPMLPDGYGERMKSIAEKALDA